MKMSLYRLSFEPSYTMMLFVSRLRNVGVKGLGIIVERKATIAEERGGGLVTVYPLATL